MAEFIGRRVNLGMSRETSRGVNPGTVTYWVPRTELTFQDRAEKVVSGEAHGHIDDATDAFVTALYGEGTIGGEIRDKSFGLLLYSILGSLTTSALGGSNYSHAFTESNSNQHQSLHFFLDDPNAGDSAFPLVMLNSLSITIETGQLAKYSADFVSRAGDDTAVSATYTAENRFISHHTSVKLATDVSGLGAASKIPLKSLTLTFTKNVMRDHNFGTIQPTEIHNQQFAVEGSFTLNNESNAYRDLMITANTYRALRLAMANTDVSLGGGYNPALTIDLSRCHFFGWERNNELDTISGQTINFKALKDISGGLNIVNACTLVNQVASY